jgi:nitroreductase
VSVNSRSIGGLTPAQVHDVLEATAAAPSLHNSQPWRLDCSSTLCELHADHGRDLPAADPHHREMLLACGAALLNLRLAIRALGVAANVRLMPDPSRPSLLAVIRPQGTIVATEVDKQLAAAVFRRHTNRRPFLDQPVPQSLWGALRQAARSEQAWLALVPPAQQSQLRGLVDVAHRTQLADPQFVEEWRKWTGRSADSVDGVAVASSGIMPEQQDLWMRRDFSGGQGRLRVAGRDFESDPLVAVIGSFNDLPLAQLQAGQALQRVLLTATVEGLYASFLSQVVEVPQTRRQLRTLIGGGLWPQTVLRLGYGSPAPATRRRGISEWAQWTPGWSSVSG